MTRHHTHRTKLTALGAALAAVLALAGCGGSATGNEGAVDDDGNVDLSKVTLTVGDQKGGSKALLTAAGLLDDVEYDVEWKEFTSGPPLLEALSSNAIHIGGVGNTPPLFAAAGKGEFQAIQAATYGGTGDAIVVPPSSPIKSVADLEGKTIGVAEGSSANYNLLAQLEKAGLKFSDVTVKDLQPGDALAAFDAGHLDAWAIWEPYTSQAEIEAGAKVIADGTDVVNGLVFQAASNAALEDEATATALQDYVGRIAQAQVWSQTHQEEWAKVWAEETGLPEEVTLAAVKKRKIELVPIDQSVIDSEQEMADTFVANDLLPEEYDVSPYFSDEYNHHTTGEK
ncbi:MULTISPECIES: ABC transporter substrate-binding protein [unclassified Nocardioides]|uniref:ABC transporter substrate-binding protein n=1 Tax=unclassified Nocardioides TaxID=2615069 RepID=UPI00360D3FC5